MSHSLNYWTMILLLYCEILTLVDVPVEVPEVEGWGSIVSLSSLSLCTVKSVLQLPCSFLATLSFTCLVTMNWKLFLSGNWVWCQMSHDQCGDFVNQSQLNGTTNFLSCELPWGNNSCWHNMRGNLLIQNFLLKNFVFQKLHSSPTFEASITRKLIDRFQQNFLRT